MTGWFDALSSRRVKRGANFLNGSSRYCSHRPSGSMVWRSLSRTLNPCFMSSSGGRIDEDRPGGVDPLGAGEHGAPDRPRQGASPRDPLLRGLLSAPMVTPAAFELMVGWA